ncbi:exo-alpha-sialidase [Actinosynnema sp. NPDC047251]|uniref:exo-alpha-sialidase n=1 Tax=Saccharothrix espanaensis (strain ATCC 51144 / DSM 44229 / JCM 9112 / NBRC 15066 / NRRL 15764) TaxID=1179773 RepID=K0JW90_SACES|nr:exo-alpha-sialidase [Saccharothrix espanaensis]CCH28453.1 Neuraminidase like protein [Saccharothrix espanaensis DSM 44229]
MRLLVTVLALLLAGSSVAAASGVAPSTSSIGVEHVLFKSGTGGYGCYRIPALVRTASGALLAFAEGRRSPSCADRGDIDLVVRRSTNDGRTWSPTRVVLRGFGDNPFAPYTRGNPAPVVDAQTGRVFLLSTSNPAVPGGERLPWVQHSDDDGLTWSTSRQIPASFAGSTRGWFATGPSHGVQLRNGNLVVGAHQGVDGHVYAGVLYSTDHGDTWHASTTPDSLVEGKLNPGEMSVAELPNGDVYVAGRNHIATGHHRTRAISKDGGASVSASTAIPTLTTPDVQGSVLALRSGTLLFAGPSDPQDRKLMRIRHSTDNGVTWTAGGLVNGSRAGYSDLAELTTGEIGLLYEGGEKFSADEIRFTRFTTQQAQVPGGTNPAGPATPAPGPTSPDVSPEANDAYVRGSVGGGLVGQADLPWTRSLDVGADDFTVSFSFKHNGSTADQALFWAYGQGGSVPQVWLRVAKSGQVVAWVQGSGGGATTSVPGAFADGAWHQLTLTRQAGQVTLAVDAASTSATGVAGVVGQVGGRTGIRLGARLDGADPFTGTLKDFTLTRAGRVVADLPLVTVDGAATATRTTVAITDDLTGHCADGTLLGGHRVPVAGKFGSALDVDSTHPGAEVPYLAALDPGGRDFTYSLWFQHKGGADQALLWAYGATAGKPSVWVRAQPGSDRLYGWVQTDVGQVAVQVKDGTDAAAFGDGKWHQLVLRRVGDRVELSVDGGAPAVATGLTGSVGGPLGVRVGSKPDGSDVLDGVLDDVKLDIAGVPVLRWGFDGQNTQAHDVVRVPAGPGTPDGSQRCNHAAVRGGAATTAGAVGRGLAFDGVDDSVVVPYEPVDGADFAVSTSFKYSGGGDQVLVWAYGVGATERALWLRAQPSKDRLLAWVQTDAGAFGVAAEDPSAVAAFGDGKWHRAELRRTGDRLELSVDGVVSGRAEIRGSLNYSDGFAVDGFQLGARPDGADRFKGALDEFRVERGGATLVHLPFEVVSGREYVRG